MIIGFDTMIAMSRSAHATAGLEFPHNQDLMNTEIYFLFLTFSLNK